MVLEATCRNASCSCARSQIAEALWRELSGPEWEAHSAGTRPAGFVHALAVEVMAEGGVDLGAARSKSVDGFLGQAMDVVVTVCDEARPVLPGAQRRLHWPFEDPAQALGSPEEQRQTFRRVRDEIEATIRTELRRASERAGSRGRGG